MNQIYQTHRFLEHGLEKLVPLAKSHDGGVHALVELHHDRVFHRATQGVDGRKLPYRNHVKVQVDSTFQVEKSHSGELFQGHLSNW